MADKRAVEREVAQSHGYNRPYVLGPQVGQCPGTAEYGRGLTLTAVHAGNCCQRWAQLIDLAAQRAPQ